MEKQRLGEFLFSHLAAQGVRHCFGLPGDYILPLYKMLEQTPGIEPVVGTHEPCAAFSADAYARQTGLGVLLVTHGVGGFNALNGVAGAYAESSPVLVISGGPSRDYVDPSDVLTPLKHHLVKKATTQREVFEHVTDRAWRLERPETAAATIQAAVAHCVESKLPVYLEIPTDLMTTPIDPPPASPKGPPIDSVALDRMSDLFVQRILAAREPVLLVGEETARHRLQEEVLQIMRARHMPAAMTLLGKGALAEDRPGVLGVYAGVLSPTDEIRRRIEASDLVVMLGTKVTDVNCGAFTADLKRERLLIAKTGWCGDGFVCYSGKLPFAHFVRALARRLPAIAGEPRWPRPTPFQFGDSESLMDRYIGVIEEQLSPQSVVIADTGDAMFGSFFLKTRRELGYLAPAFYGTMGFAVPAALGAQLANPQSRPLVLVGDGAFQMTGLELSTIARRRLNPIVILFNNGGFGMQRVLVDGPFNDIGQWDYCQLPALLGAGRASRVSTPEQLSQALETAHGVTDRPVLIEAVLEKRSHLDCPESLHPGAPSRENGYLPPLQRGGNAL